MAYIVNADDQSRPLDTDPRKQGAEELRALKARLIQTRTALEGADSTNAAAAAAALAAANAAQSSANNAQSSANAAQSAANAAQGTANNAQSSANSALALAQAVTFKNCVELTGSGTWTVPAGVTQVLAILVSGSTASGQRTETSIVDMTISSYIYKPITVYLGNSMSNTNTVFIGVTEGTPLAYSCGAGEVARTDYANIGYGGGRTSNMLASVAQATVFDGHTANPPIPPAQHTAYPTPANTVNEMMHRLADRNLAFSFLQFGAGAGGSGSFAGGDAGRIMLFY